MWRLVAVAMVLAGTALAHGQDPILEVDGGEGVDFGWAAACVGDLNDDGMPDVAVGAPDMPSETQGTSWGAVVICDGMTGDVLKTIRPRHLGRGFGRVVRVVGDFDHDAEGERDGNDLFIAAPGDSRYSTPPGYAVVISLDDLLDVTVPPDHEPSFTPADDYAYTELLHLVGRSSTGDFGTTVASLGDATGDGVPDIAVGEPGTYGANPGGVRVFSGADGEYLPALSIEDAWGGGNLGFSLCSLGDVNGDGLGDYAAGAPFFADDGGPGKLTSPNGRISLVFSSSGGPTARYDVGGRSRNYNGTRMGGGLGAGIGSGSVSPGGGRNLVVSGFGGGGYVQVHGLASISHVPSKIGGISKPKLVPIAEYTGVGGRLTLIPSCDGRTGLEILIGSDDRLTLLSFGEKKPLEVAHIDAPEGEWFGPVLGVAADLGSEGSRLPDQTDDLLIGSPATGRAFALPLPRVPAVLPAKAKLGAVFHTGAAATGTKAKGKLKTKIAKGKAAFNVAFAKLPSAGAHALFLETGPGSEKFVEIGSFTGPSGKIDLDAVGTLPEALGTRDLAELGGRLLELRDAAGGVVLSTVLPYPGELPKAKSMLSFEPAPGSPYPQADGSAKLTLVSKTGADSVKLKVTGVPKSETLELWVETKAGSGDFEKMAQLSKGKLTLKAKTLSFFDPFPRADLQSLMERAAQVRSGDGQVVLHRVLESVPTPDLKVNKVSLTYLGVGIDSFTVRADVKNKGTGDVATVALLARITFDGTIERSDGTVTTVDFPAGERREGLVVANFDNPYAGQHPRVVVTVVVDPDSTGGSGQYVELREDNNEREAVFEWSEIEGRYERQ